MTMKPREFIHKLNDNQIIKKSSMDGVAGRLVVKSAKVTDILDRCLHCCYSRNTCFLLLQAKCEKFRMDKHLSTCCS